MSAACMCLHMCVFLRRLISKWVLCFQPGLTPVFLTRWVCVMPAKSASVMVSPTFIRLSSELIQSSVTIFMHRGTKTEPEITDYNLFLVRDFFFYGSELRLLIRFVLVVARSALLLATYTFTQVICLHLKQGSFRNQ